MALRVPTSRRLRLAFESLVEKPDELRWAVGREPQPAGKEWCWALSLANVLTAFGREVVPERVVKRFRARHGHVGADDGHNLAREHWLLFYREYFPEAAWLRQPPDPDYLRAVLAHSPLIGVLDNSTGDHLLVISGIRNHGGTCEVGISDSLWEGRCWLPWEELTSVQAQESPAHWGPWKETIFLGRPDPKHLYVFRFVADVGRLETEAALPLRKKKAETVLPSRLKFAKKPKNPFPLAEELSLALLGFLLVYERRAPESITEHTYLHESIPLHVWRKRPLRPDRELMEHFRRFGWHHQLLGETGEPREYAQTRRIDEDWRTRWIGRSWLTEAVGRAIRWLDRHAGDEPDEVEMLWLQFGPGRHVHLLRLTEKNRYLVAKASWRHGRRIWQADGRFRLLDENEVVNRVKKTSE